jgi:DNA polymerase elongation subunit (family B)
MQLKGNLLDISFREDTVFLWFKTESSRLQLSEQYYPDIFVIPQKGIFKHFFDLFSEHPHIKRIEMTERKVSIGNNQKKPVLRVYISSIERYKPVLNLIRKYAEVFDSDLSHTQRYLADKGLIPISPVSVRYNKKKQIQSITQLPVSLDVDPPYLSTILFEIIQREQSITILTLNQRIQIEHRFSGRTKEALSSFHKFIEEKNPDILISIESDMDTLFRLSAENGLPLLGKVTRKYIHLSEGRIFLNLMTYRRIGLAGMVERIQYTREVPRLSSNWAAGRAIESRQCYEARKAGVLLPRKAFFQPVMSLKRLLCERDHGGLIFAPSVGLHENVAALDFESMFPHLIIKKNISYENINTDKKKDGFLLDFTRETLSRRLYFKHLKKELVGKPEKWFWCESRQQALKEILFCTYGYSGCWANKFGNMDTFMEINKEARENLVSALNIARADGYVTLYGNNDSLFLHKTNATRENYDFLSKKISKNLELPITVENHFKHLILLPQKSEKKFGAVNRYYGITYDGELICRGIELRRRNTPPFIVSTQTEALYRLLNQKTSQEVLTNGILEAEKVFSKAVRALSKGIVPIKELGSQSILRRRPFAYKSRPPQVAAAEALDINGTFVDCGSVINYIYVDSKHKNPFRRVTPTGFYDKYDRSKYIQLLKEAEKSILLPFNREKNKSSLTRLSYFFS